MKGLPIIPFDGADHNGERSAPAGRESPFAITVTLCPHRSNSWASSATTSSIPPYADGGTGYQGGAISMMFMARLPPVAGHRGDHRRSVVSKNAHGTCPRGR